jgi:hypothetical protein
MPNNNSNNSNNNKFTIVDFPKDGLTYGSFSGKVPKKVASKAFSSLMQFMDINNEENNSLGKFIVFVIKNVNTGKMYKYIGNRVKLENPIKITKNNKEIIYKYKNVIGKYKDELDKI